MRKLTLSIWAILLGLPLCATGLSADLPFIAKGEQIPLKANQTYTLRVTTSMRNCSFVKQGVGKNPVVVFYGGRSSTAFIGSGSFTDIDFNCGAWTYAWGGGGTVSMTRCNVWGGGGFIKADGADVTLTNCKQLAKVAEYVIYGARSSTNIQGCSFIFGSTNAHLIREHEIIKFTMDHTVLNNLMCSYGAALRLHQGSHATGGEVEMGNDEIHGDFDLGPMQEGDGGQDLQTVLDKGGTLKPSDMAKLVQFKADRLNTVRISHTLFDTNDCKINTGVLDAIISDCTIKDVKGGAVIDTPFPYIGRPASVVQFINDTISHRDGAGRVFSGVDGSGSMSATSTTFNGKPFSKPAATQPSAPALTH